MSKNNHEINRSMLIGSSSESGVCNSNVLYYRCQKWDVKLKFALQPVCSFYSVKSANISNSERNASELSVKIHFDDIS